MPEFREPNIPSVSFAYESFLLFNGRPIEVPDIVETYFDTLVALSRDAIFRQIEILKLRRHDTGSVLPNEKTIRIGHLAQLGNEEHVLSDQGLQYSTNAGSENVTVVLDWIEALDIIYRNQWTHLRDRIDTAQPVVETGVSKISETFDGTWLSLSID